MINKFWQALKQNFWPVSAILFCPCHLPLTMGAAASLTAGTVVGNFIALNYSSIETVLAVAFSFYFVLAFMIWVVRGPKQQEGEACVINADGKRQLNGLSTHQIVVWGIIGMFTTPALVSVSVFTEKSFLDEGIISTVIQNSEFNSGFIWLISIAVVVMIPIMVIWLVWLWLAWTKIDPALADTENWTYEHK